MLRQAAASPSVLRRRYLVEAGACITCIVLAFHQLLPKPPATSGELSASRAVELLLVGCATLLALALPGGVRTLPQAARNAAVIVGGFTTWAFLSALWSPLPAIAAAKSIELAAIAFVAFRIVAAAPGVGQERVAVLCDAVVFAVSFAVLALLAANIVQSGTLLPFDDLIDSDPFAIPGRTRLLLGQNHPLTSAGLLSFAMVFAFNSSFRPTVKLAAIGCFGVLFWMCDARGMTTALPVSIALSAFLRAPPSVMIAWAGLAATFVAIGATLLFLAHVDLDAFLAQIFGEDVTSLNSRSGLWAFSIERALLNPLGGVGYFGSRLELLSAFPFAGHAHNTFIEAFLGTGLPGLAFTVAFVGFAVARVFTTRDPLLAGLLPLIAIEANLNPILMVPCVPMFLFTASLFGAAGPAPASAPGNVHPAPHKLFVNGPRRSL